MKKKLLLLAVVCFQFLILNGQSDWFEPGAEWFYGQRSYTLDLEGLLKLEHLNEDTLINGESYQKLNFLQLFGASSGSIDTVYNLEKYVRQEGNKIYQFKEEKLKLYDFDLSVGDTLDFVENEESDSYVFIVDSIGSINLGGEELSFQDIVIRRKNNPNHRYSELRIIEKLGATNAFFFTEYTKLFIADAPIHELRCYEDENTPVIKLLDAPFDCGFIPSTVGIKERAKWNNIKAYPNPVTQGLNVEVKDSGIVFLQLLNTTGKVIREIENEEQSDVYIEMNAMSNGVYFIVGYNEQGASILTKKIIKNDR